jgi:hypothetical protein
VPAIPRGGVTLVTYRKVDTPYDKAINHTVGKRFV